MKKEKKMPKSQKGESKMASKEKEYEKLLTEFQLKFYHLKNNQKKKVNQKVN